MARAVKRSLQRQTSAPPVELMPEDMDDLNEQQFHRFMETGTLPRNFSFKGVKKAIPDQPIQSDGALLLQDIQ